MEGSKQCPECKCTDVPINAEICPFCGYSFGGQTEAKPAGTGKQTEAQPTKTEKKPETTGVVMDTNKEPAIPKTKEEVKPSVSEGSAVETGTAGPEPSDYTIYKKRGLKKQIVAETAPQEKGGKTTAGWLAAALVVAVLLMTTYCLNQMVNRFPARATTYVRWSCILGGMMDGFLHVCCYANEKGSRRAGILGIILGAIGLLGLMAFDGGGQFIGLYMSKYSLRGNIIKLVIYAVCWLTAAKLAKNRKNAFVFCLTGAELILLPYLTSWLMYQVKPQIVGWPFAVTCAAMLVTDFLLYRIKAWLALKPRKLFWVLYVIVMIVALVSLYDSRRLLFL